MFEFPGLSLNGAKDSYYTSSMRSSGHSKDAIFEALNTKIIAIFADKTQFFM